MPIDTVSPTTKGRAAPKSRKQLQKAEGQRRAAEEPEPSRSIAPPGGYTRVETPEARSERNKQRLGPTMPKIDRKLPIGGKARALNAHEAKLLLYVAYQTQERPELGANIDDMDRYMEEVPVHDHVTTLGELGLIYMPSNGSDIPLTRNRAVTDEGFRLALMYQEGKLKPERPRGEPEDVDLPGDIPAELVGKPIAEIPKSVLTPPPIDRDTRPAPTGNWRGGAKGVGDARGRDVHQKTDDHSPRQYQGQ